MLMDKLSASADKKKLNRAVLLHSKGDLGLAKKLYLGLVKKYPDDPDVNNYFGALHLQMHVPNEAVPLLEKAARLKADDADIFFNLAKAYADSGDFERALETYLQTLTIDPRHNRANYNLGNLYKGGRLFEQAQYYLLVDIDIEPKHDAYCMLGEISVEQNDYQQAHQYFTQALALNAQSPLLKSKLVAMSYHLSARADRLETSTLVQSIKLLDEALQDCRKEDQITLLVLKADFLYLFGHAHSAIDSYFEALRLGPLGSNGYNSLGCALLSVGRFQEAWPHCKHRFNVATFDVGAVSSKIACCSKPIWQGGVEAGKHLLITSEQGIGDQLLHSGNLVTLHEAGMDVTLTCAPKLVGLIARCFPFASVFPDCVPIPDSVDEQVDFQTNVITLSSHLLTNPEKIKPATHITSVPEWGAHFKQKYQQFGGKLKVGIAWRSKSGSCGARKSIELEQWRPFLENQKIQCVSIQYGAMDDHEQALMRQAPFSNLYVDTEFDPYDEIDKAIAQIEALDVVVSVSNVGVHYAGQIGKPCWVLVPEAALWHWFVDTQQSPWYPSVLIERRVVGQSWEELLVSSYKKLLKQFVASH